MKRKAILCGFLAAVMVFSGIIGSFSPVACAVNTDLDDSQKNAISMLNYLTVLTESINRSKNSRLFLEEAYSNLLNNIYPNAVDSQTIEQLNALLNLMEDYRMLSIKRERLQYL